MVEERLSLLSAFALMDFWFLPLSHSSNQGEESAIIPVAGAG